MNRFVKGLHSKVLGGGAYKNKGSWVILRLLKQDLRDQRKLLAPQKSERQEEAGFCRAQQVLQAVREGHLIRAVAFSYLSH